MPWFKRKQKGILTGRHDRQNVSAGQWLKCPACSQVSHRRELDNNLWICPKCDHHLRFGSRRYFDLLFDNSTYTPHDADLISRDPLTFTDRKAYADRLRVAAQKTGMNDAARSATGTIGGHSTSVAAMDFSFIGGSMGSVVGEVVARAIKRAVARETPLIIISQSGGARMMEGALSLMQMAKTSANLTLLDKKGLPYISVLTHPTTGGVTASFAMLGDINIAEPGALIGFAGPRVIRETIGQDLPPGFQSSEFLQDHGFVDMIVDRRQLRGRIVHILDLILESSGP